MEKKRYINPLTYVEVLNTKELMSVSEKSGLPDDPGLAPRRRTDVF